MMGCIIIGEVMGKVDGRVMGRMDGMVMGKVAGRAMEIVGAVMGRVEKSRNPPQKDDSLMMKKQPQSNLFQINPKPKVLQKVWKYSLKKYLRKGPASHRSTYALNVMV